MLSPAKENFLEKLELLNEQLDISRKNCKVSRN